MIVVGNNGLFMGFLQCIWWWWWWDGHLVVVVVVVVVVYWRHGLGFLSSFLSSLQVTIFHSFQFSTIKKLYCLCVSVLW